ncbi:hypothetical protein ABZ807_26360 [Micromonospora sp. NPDC047548]|uniref:hypothetical protein n=1 Tax=Micromonospora sp. NPDC047548 TaxID=3155624 RepID=UPI0033C9056D
MSVRNFMRALTALVGGISIVMAASSPAAAITYEKNIGTKTMVGPSYWQSGYWFQGAERTSNNLGVFQANGDKWWVLDNIKDGKSVVVVWYNYRNGSLIRTGECKNNHGAPSWAVCDKDYYEDSTLWAKTCLYDSATGKYDPCNVAGWEFRVSDAKVL